MTVELKLPVLTKEKKEELIDNIIRNGAKVMDPDFKSLEEYLKRNPLEEVQ